MSHSSSSSKLPPWAPRPHEAAVLDDEGREREEGGGARDRLVTRSMIRARDRSHLINDGFRGYVLWLWRGGCTPRDGTGH